MGTGVITAPESGAVEDRWRPRNVQRLGLRHVADMTLKAYGLLADPELGLGRSLVAAADRQARAAATTIAATPHRKAGFLILHRERETAWLRIDWWLPEGTLAGLVWQGSAEGGAFIPLTPPTTCVWELALIDHERRAWVRTGMAPTADTAAYFDDVYRQDFC
jgi:hypothetical protein